jgi:hypothetical protein
MAVLAGGTQSGEFAYQSKSPDEAYLRPLSLGSLYGPYHSPDKYDALRRGARDGAVRVHAFPRGQIDRKEPPAFDLAREDDGKAILHDPRNDDTPILSQISALFFALHNHCAALLRQRLDGDLLFEVCRDLTVETYQGIVRNDLLKTLLHPDVRQHYASKGVLIDRAATVSSLPSVELMQGVFRFGHAMVQPTYRLSGKGRPLLLTDLLRGFRNMNELRHYDPGFWKIDWRLFFGENAQKSAALAPSFAPVFAEVPGLQGSGAGKIRIGEEHGDWRNDLVMRDLARSADSGLASLAGLIEEVRPWFDGDGPISRCVSFDSTKREAAIRQWCSAAFPGGIPDELGSFVMTDPPLGFYTLLEASLPVENGGGGGFHLGTLGSILLAEAVYAALEASGSTFRTSQKINRLRHDVFTEGEPPATMAALIEFLSHAPKQQGER